MKLISPVSQGDPKGADKASAMAFKNSLSGDLNDYQVLIREHLQNSSDAFNKSKLYDKLKFKVSRTQLDFSNTDLNGLLSLYQDYHDYTNVQQEKAAMQQAITDLKNLKGNYNNLWVIRIEDNAGGLDGVSRNEQFGSGRILSEYITDKGTYGGGSKGSFGVGKITGFVLLNKTFTVFYYNRHEANGEDYLIGKVKLPTFRKDDTLYGENACIGTPINDSEGNPIKSNWTVPDDSQRKFRGLEENGLTTIIPSFTIPQEDESEWSLIIAYSIIHSFFKMFEKDEIEVIISDDFNSSKMNITNKNYQKVYSDIGNQDFINGENYLKNKYDYLITKPFVFNSQESKNTFQLDLNIKRGYKGKAILSLYRNPELNEFFEDQKNKILQFDSKALRSVRLLRDGMLLRESRYPARVLPVCQLSGYIEFENSINEIIREGENLRHDDFDYRNLEEVEIDGFPSKNTVHQKLHNPLNKFVRESIESIVKEGIEEHEEFDIELDFQGENSTDNDNVSFNRISSLEALEIPTSVLSSVVTGNKGVPTDKYSKGTTQDSVIIEIPSYTGNKNPNPKPPNPKPKPKPKPKPEIGEKGTKNKGKKPRILPELTFLSRLDKIQNPKKGIKNYQIRVENWNEHYSEIILSQKSEARNPIITFNLIELKIDGKKHKSVQVVRKKNDISHFIISNIPKKESNSLIIEVKVKESMYTEPNFSLKLKV